MTKNASYSKILLIAAALLILLIYGMGMVIIPIIISGIISIGVYPIYKYLIKKNIPSVLSSLIVVFSLSSLLAMLFFFMSYEGTTILTELPIQEMPNSIEKSGENFEKTITKNTPIPEFDFASKAKSLLSKVVNYIPDFLLKLKDMLVFVASCPIYIFFMLLYNQNFKNAYDAFAKKLDKEKQAQIIADIKQAYRSYIVGMFWVIGIVSTLTAFGLWIVGVPHPIFLGSLAGVLTVIPYLGVIISASVPSLLALLVMDSWWALVGVISVFVIVQFLEGNIITPKILGDKVNVNPLSIVLAMVFLGSIGGILAMVITVPLLSIVLVISKHNPHWKPLYELLKS